MITEDDDFVTVIPDLHKVSAIIAFTQCGHCGLTIPQSLALEAMNDHWCNDECFENEKALEQLRRAGL